MSPQTTGATIACWRIKGDTTQRLNTGPWMNGAPAPDELKEYERLGWEIEYAYTLDDAALATLALANMSSTS